MSSGGSFAVSSLFPKLDKNIVWFQNCLQSNSPLRAASHIAFITIFSFHCNSRNGFNQIRDPFNLSTFQCFKLLYLNPSWINSLNPSFQLGSGVCTLCQILAELSFAGSCAVVVGEFWSVLERKVRLCWRRSERTTLG